MYNSWWKLISREGRCLWKLLVLRSSVIHKSKHRFLDRMCSIKQSQNITSERSALFSQAILSQHYITPCQHRGAGIPAELRLSVCLCPVTFSIFFEGIFVLWCYYYYFFLQAHLPHVLWWWSHCCSMFRHQPAERSPTSPSWDQSHSHARGKRPAGPPPPPRCPPHTADHLGQQETIHHVIWTQTGDYITLWKNLLYWSWF